MHTDGGNTGFIRRYAISHCVIWVIVFIPLMVGENRLLPWWALAGAYGPAIYVAWSFMRIRQQLRAIRYSFRDVWAVYWHGLSRRQVEAMVGQIFAEEDAHAEILGQAQELVPDLVPRVQELLDSDNMMAAKELISRTQRQQQKEAEQQSQQVDSLCERAKQANCLRLVQLLAAEGRFKQAETILSSCLSLAARAKVLNVEAQAVRLIAHLDQPDFSGVEALLKAAEDQRAQEKLMNDLKTRIAQLRSDDRRDMRQRLQQLAELRFGTRDFRKALHDLEVELARAEGAKG